MRNCGYSYCADIAPWYFYSRQIKPIWILKRGNLDEKKDRFHNTIGGYTVFSVIAYHINDTI